MENDPNLEYILPEQLEIDERQITWRTLAVGAAILELTLLPMMTSGLLPVSRKALCNNWHEPHGGAVVNREKSMRTILSFLYSSILLKYYSRCTDGAIAYW